MAKDIIIKGARVNNLKNVDLTIPRDKLTVLTGLSGSGKSSLAFDTLYAEGHEHLSERVTVPIRTATFNLGWLPGGDKRITTHWETTRAAISAALSLLVKGGVCTICAYPGHAAGDEERAALMAYLSALRPQEYNVLHHRFLNAGAGAPECFVVQRQ